MNPTPRPKILMAILATGILALGALALSVEAKPGDGASGSDHRTAAQDKRDAAQDRREAAQDKRELKDEIKEKCEAAKENSSMKARCDHLKDAVKARRVAHALLTAIRVHERELGRVTFRIAEVQEKLQNSTLNATQKQVLENRLGKLQDRQAHLIQQIKDEQAKLQRLHDKWAEVADHLRDRKEKGEDDGGVDDSGSETGQTTSSSPTTSA